MQFRSTERKTPEPVEVGQLLAARYPQLMRWAVGLARNDRTKAEEIVQELCLYLTLAKPDFTQVNNLDGYLFTCLRHVYTSSLARASRDALRLVSLEEYDSFAMAVSGGGPGDVLQQQNDLRRACAYAVWRKETSKTASYFILHFFHGYGRQEIASIAQVTMAAVYNKLKAARSEVGAYLQNAGKLRLIDREPPAPILFWNVVPVAELFTELRGAILRARRTACLPEPELMALYNSPAQQPIACELLAHIVSCEPCLAVIDRVGRRPTLKDREPLDVYGYSPRDGEATPGAGGDRYARMMEDVQRKWKRTYDHRPRSLSIALNGEVIATHDVRSEHNRLSARLETPGPASFIEVFSEQNERLALMPVEVGLPQVTASGPLRIGLSDARYLELKLTLDGQGLESEVVYFDPALSQLWADDEEAAAVAAVVAESPRVSLWERFQMILMPATAWAFVLLLAAGLGYWAYLSRPLPWRAVSVLDHASQVEAAALRGQTEHQVVRLEEVSAGGSKRNTATIDLWKDEGGRYIRRLFDSQHQLLAVEWHGTNQGTARRRGVRRADALVSQFWEQELSARAFAGIQGGEPKGRRTANGYELTKDGPSQQYPKLVSATLVLNSRFEAVEQRLLVQTASGTRQLRFVQESYDLKPSHTVADEVFNPDGDSATDRRGRVFPGPHGVLAGDEVSLAELEIEALYVLRSLGADTGQPIEVKRTPDGQLQVAGVVTNDNLRREIDARLRALANSQFLELKIARAGIAPPAGHALSSQPMESYEVSQAHFAADTPVRQYFERKGLTGEALNHAVEQFSLDALAHAQKALQHAYALERLGKVVTGDELRYVSEPKQQEWTEMVHEHAGGVDRELRSLQKLLVSIWPPAAEAEKPEANSPAIENPSQYLQATRQLLGQVSGLNEHVGELFTADGRAGGDVNLETLLKTTMDIEALDDSARMSEFATRLHETANGKRAATPNE